MDNTLISILLVVRNSELFISNIIKSLIKQNLNKNDYEIIIVDGCSTDNTIKVAEELLKKNKIQFKIIQNKKKTLASGWNLGIKNAKGKYVIRPDAHAKLELGYIKNGIKKLESNKKLAAVGGILKTKSDTFIGKIIAKVLSNPIGVGTSSFRIGVKTDTFTDTAVYAIYRKKIFDEVGLFNEELARNQDIEFHKRVKEAGYKFLTSPDMKAVYYSRASIKKFLKQGFQNGFWVTFGHGGHFRHKIPMFFFIVLLISVIISPKLFVTILLFYFLLVILSFITFSHLNNPVHLFLSTILTFLLHLFYGSGSLFGYVKQKFL